MPMEQIFLVVCLPFLSPKPNYAKSFCNVAREEDRADTKAVKNLLAFVQGKGCFFS